MGLCRMPDRSLGTWPWHVPQSARRLAEEIRKERRIGKIGEMDADAAAQRKLLPGL